MTLLALAVVPAVLLVMGVPIFVVLMTATLGGILLSVNPVQAIHSAMFGSLDIFPLLAVPLFIYAGDIMARGGIARRLIELILAMVGGVRGSLGLSTIAACEVFGVMSGSSVACVAAIGKLTIPSLKKNGYGERFSVSLVTATGVIDVIIPPSIPMIIYGIAAQQSVPLLFLAGFVPGILIGVALAIYVYFYARKKAIPIAARPEPGTIRQMLRGSVWAIFAPVVIFGGIYGGMFTPTEAAGVACIYAILVSMFVYREITWADLWAITLESAALSAQVLVIVSAAGAFAWLITTSGYPANSIAFVSQPEARDVDAAARHQRHPAVRRQRAGASGRDPDADALAYTGRPCGRGRSDPFRHHRHRQLGDRHVHAAVRLEPVCRQRAVQDAAAGALPRRDAVPGDLSHHADADDLHPGDHAGAAEVVPMISGGGTPR